ncbi:protein SSUH2 homolog [Trichonephila clavipes]|uniref:Protein SSUH2 homolog n=1 Tax=Trichonephila clavipes TaxID=2585209 RepID=A0A8X6RCF6_TRICX|nr:protein SSUH2 homolog [Trichonephila clavipes]
MLGHLAASDEDGLVSLNDEELRRFCHKYIEIDCCYGSRFIKEMILTEIWNDCAFLYTVESLTEKRETCLAHTPYIGRLKDGPEEEGSPPDHWLVHVNAPSGFVDNTTTTEIPFSAYIKICAECNGLKQWSCFHCDERGKEKCQICNGSGWDDDCRCFTCGATGKISCGRCHETKILKCATCDAYGKLRYYTKLTVKCDVSRFNVSSDDNRVCVRRSRGKRLNPAFTLQRCSASTAGVIVRGAIAYNTRSPLVLILCTLAAQRYVNDILQPHVLPLMQRLPEAILQQVNSRPHTVRVSQDCLCYGYYHSLACQFPRFVSNRRYLGSFGMASWSFHGFELETRL